jgi:dienelactone hydrolase
VAIPYLSAAAFLIDISGQEVSWRRWLPARVAPVIARNIQVPTRYGEVTGRLYHPVSPSASTPAVLVIPGLHTAGVEEPRLARLTERLAAEGLTVLSLPLPDLRQLRVTPESTDVIEDAALWLSSQPSLAPDGRITLFGISFGGGLSLVAAGRPSLAGRLHAVVAFGGHGDLPRVLRYLCTGTLPDGTRQPAHDYGAAIFLLGALPHLVPADQVEPLDHAIRMFLDASILDVPEPARATLLFAEAKALGDALPEPARSIMADASARDMARLGPRLLPLLERIGGDPALSAERAPATAAPVFLLHGTPDPIIPQTETTALAAFYQRVPSRRSDDVEMLLTPTISPADAANRITPGDAWPLVKFWISLQSEIWNDR